jgi:multisubunit Na+/H+ antiporter MnhE subunit|tara:strand:- start:310 stop:534 length:225 start_codon:yes stop_codon:yes gene_type:complete
MTLTEKIVGVLAILAFILITGVAKANPVTNWITNEKNKIVEYQTKSWSDSKIQFAQTKQTILNLFKSKKNVTQD